MRILIPLALFALVSACSGAKTDAPGAQTRNEAAAPAPGALPLATDVADSHAKPRPGELRVFKDWTVGCDNALTCKAVALGPEDGDMPETLMSIARAGGPDGDFTVRINGSKLPSLPVTVAVDGKPVAHGGTLVDQKSAVEFTAANARAIATAAANGQTLILQGAKGDTVAVTLAGVSAALRYIDAQQGLAGTGSAIVARGDGQASTPAPALPVIRALTASGDARKLADAEIAALRKADECEIADYMPDPPRADYAALGGGKTLMLMPCSSGAYNLIAVPYIIGADGKAELARFDAESGFGEAGQAPQLVNAAFDGTSLVTFAKARGLGDCGVSQSFVWDGSQFRLSEQSEMGECRGSVDYITTWRAQVVR